MAKTGEALISFVSKRPNYRASGISESQLALLNGAGRLVFLLNGWNEISAESTSAALLSLKGMMRDSSATCMLASGTDDFADIYEHLLENGDSQVRIEFYRTWQPFPLTALGDEPLNYFRA